MPSEGSTSSTRKLKATDPSDENLFAFIDFNEESPESKRSKGTPPRQSSQQTTSFHHTAMAKDRTTDQSEQPQQADAPAAEQRPSQAPANASIDHIVSDYTKALMKPRNPAPPFLVIDANDIARVSTPAHTDLNNHQGSNIHILHRKRILRRQAVANKAGRPFYDDPQFHTLWKLEEAYRGVIRELDTRVMYTEEYMLQLARCGFLPELEMVRRIEEFVDKVWGGLVTVTEVWIVAVIAMSYGS